MHCGPSLLTYIPKQATNLFTLGPGEMLSSPAPGSLLAGLLWLDQTRTYTCTKDASSSVGWSVKLNRDELNLYDAGKFIAAEIRANGKSNLADRLVNDPRPAYTFKPSLKLPAKTVQEIEDYLTTKVSVKDSATAPSARTDRESLPDMDWVHWVKEGSPAVTDVYFVKSIGTFTPWVALIAPKCAKQKTFQLRMLGQMWVYSRIPNPWEGITVPCPTLEALRLEKFGPAASNEIA